MGIGHFTGFDVRDGGQGEEGQGVIGAAAIAVVGSYALQGVYQSIELRFAATRCAQCRVGPIGEKS